MYLKALEMIGFKSFAQRTRLEFAPGMSAIVGPNGCGKSNVSDAIRWVLGEQSAKLLRGSKMEDCIFNGTDKRKPLGMAEVSLTLTGCEQALGTEFHEVTITRRVFRSGEGRYFINKVPCRLRDIQRLFMDTGIGTSSYSLMEQGRIDLILSSRPEDRREVFEEASGITKYKADKREALRKLDQTEANLLRLADIIKEVRRQIISLQRQAGKAARYKKFKEELRRLDIYVARDKLRRMDSERIDQEQRLKTIRENLAEHQESIRRQEEAAAVMREQMEKAEVESGDEQQALMDLSSKHDRTRQSVETARQRITDLEEQSQRDAADEAAAADEIESANREIEESRRQVEAVESGYAAAQAELRRRQEQLTQHEQQLESAKQAISRLLTESMDCENQLTHAQNELHRLESEDRNIVNRRERCAVELDNLKLLVADHAKRAGELNQARVALQEEQQKSSETLEACQKTAADIRRQIGEVEPTLSGVCSEKAAVSARIEMLEHSLKSQSGFSKTARKLLDSVNPDELNQYVLGALASQIESDSDCRLALETVLRAWLDAVVVRDMPAALACLRALEASADDALRLLAVDTPASAMSTAVPEFDGAVALRQAVKSPDTIAPLLDRMLAGVLVLDDLSALPDTVPDGVTFVTRQGVLIRGDGKLEIFRGGTQQSSPLSNRHMLAEQREHADVLERQISGHQSGLETLKEQFSAIEQEQQELRADLARKQQALARQEGEYNLVEQQASTTRKNLETVSWEMQELEKQGSSAESKSELVEKAEKIRVRRQEIRHQIESIQVEQTELERIQRQLAAEVTAAQVGFGKQEEARAQLQMRLRPMSERVQQLQKTMDERRMRGDVCKAEIANLRRQREQAAAELPVMNEEIQRRSTRISEIQSLREQLHATSKSAETLLRELRVESESLSRQESQTNGKCVEQRLQRQYLIERVTGEHRISADAIQLEPAPEWSDDQCPDMETLEINITELRAKLDSMGSVNTDAIQEYKEQEERYEFLIRQQDDLVKSKQQLLDLIKTINQTTTEMFAKTFAAINENFQSVFKQLFGGGSAKLMLSDDDDILECGIEIIARPPGKKLQTVSLLSGGERTMTAVALLFAIFMVKPSPFCLLDELDASLDDSNINRFVKVLQNFLQKSQFIVITHNRATISAASLLYGVTMEEPGVSKIISMRFTDHPKDESRSGAEAAVASASTLEAEPTLVGAVARNDAG